MLQATVTIKLDPSAFDLIREVLEKEQERAMAVTVDRDTDAKIRHEERVRAEWLGRIIDELRR